MVGVPRSRGCALCVKRRVKVGLLQLDRYAELTPRQCDERLPGCAKCETYGKLCPGYDRGFKFVTGKPYRERRGQINPINVDTRSGEAKSAGPANSGSGTSHMASVQKKTPMTLVSVDLNMCQSLGALVNDFAQSGFGNQRHVVAQWFGFLPSVYGQSPVLDATIKTFVAHHFGRTTQNQKMVMYARSSYGEALQRLRKSLATPSECLSSHVFCTVVLLCLYEVLRINTIP